MVVVSRIAAVNEGIHHLHRFDRPIGPSRTASQKGGTSPLSPSKTILKRSATKDTEQSVGSQHITDDVLEKYKKLDVLEVEELNSDKDTPFVDKAFFNLGIGVVIMLNAAYIGIEVDLGKPSSTPIKDRIGWYLVENVFTITFTAEMILRLYYTRFRYFTDMWNLLDCALVFLGLVDTYVLTFIGQGGKLRALSILRIARMLRLVRLVRLLRMFRELWLIVFGLIQSLKTLGWVALLLLLILYVMAIFITIMVGKEPQFLYDDKEEFDRDELFGTVPRSMYTLFQVITLESWSQDIARPIIKRQPAMVIFFILFLVVTTFGLLNIVVGVIVENTLATARNNEDKEKKQMELERMRVLKHLRDIFVLSDADQSGTITLEEFRGAFDNPEVYELLRQIELPIHEAEELFMILDGDNSGELSVDEFIGGCVQLKGNQKPKDMLALQMTLQALQKRVETVEERMQKSMQRLQTLTARMKEISALALNRKFPFSGGGGGQGGGTSTRRTTHASAAGGDVGGTGQEGQHGGGMFEDDRPYARDSPPPIPPFPAFLPESPVANE
ncbi:unnamed protein product [Vitrella brassicaformis CCMP3155]|uniref:EF-hand domain-containing protein n=1 Tax=Vitrella brassicaformis (strain CCMP3155) TaxID=1169540 RepID=A0A0G4F0G1_VITBC|nr:unnamed protein product [Vitrella brassicaformis CCMP3155]|eukprot:CEM04539.1 unnamed protein product [Vitrella brassicaformis CCMP3155]